MKAYYYWIAIIVFALDFISKQVIVSQLEMYEQIPVIGNFFLITYILNPGAAFGILKGASTFFIIITTIVVIGIIWYIERNKREGKPLLMVALGMVLGGAAGNFLDRAQHGEVVDFLQFNFGTYTFPIFNLADSGIVVGVCLILLDTLLDMKRGNENLNQDGAERHNDKEQLAEADESTR